jgi:carboxypeptidase C (cathepsin A)
MPLAGNWDEYYVPTANPDPYPPTLDPYLHSAAVTSKIGSQSTWVESNMDVYHQFAATGDWIRSARPNLEAAINAGVRTVIYDGDADYIVNYMGVEAMVRASRAFFLLSYSPCTYLVALFAQVASLTTKFSAEFASQDFATYIVNGNPAGLYKNAGTFSYLRVFGAGHEVPAYLWRGVPRGAAALQMFTQIMSGHPLSST